MEVTIPGDRLFNFADADGARAVAGVDTDLFALLELVCRDLLSRVEDVDLAAALAELELRQLNYQAALAATAKLAALPTLFELDW